MTQPNKVHEIWVKQPSSGRRFIVSKYDNGVIIVYERMTKDNGPAAGGEYVYNLSRYHYPTKPWPTRGYVKEVLDLSGIKP